jgi:dTDP-4-dehydrorhamnose 3,5-epimerase
MQIMPLAITGAWVANLDVHIDKRGSLQEWFKFDEILEATGYKFETSQANFSRSNRYVVRGIHYSLAKSGQAKWITCLNGAIRDFIVDIRVGSPTYGNWIAIDLTAKNANAILIGEGLGHAFIALEDDSFVSYLLTSNYSNHEEFQINPLDESIGIDWTTDKNMLMLSEKDASAPTLIQQHNLNKLPIYML